jgi:hypothetical protein
MTIDGQLMIPARNMASTKMAIILAVAAVELATP